MLLKPGIVGTDRLVGMVVGEHEQNVRSLVCKGKRTKDGEKQDRGNGESHGEISL